MKEPRFIPLPRTERVTPLQNPFRGFYSIYRYNAGEEKLPDSDNAFAARELTEGEELALVEINLNEYSECDIDERGLGVIRRILAFFKVHKRQMILRFLYDWNGCSIQTEPKNIEIIRSHMRALSPMLKEYSAYIFVVQGLFVGDWGEMHGGRYQSAASLGMLANSLIESIGEHTFMAVRSPALWRTLARSYEPTEEFNAFRDNIPARVGLFNDGMLASETDFGTYGDIYKSEAKSLSDKLIREHEIAFQEKLCKFVPNGGEVINACSQNDFEAALRDLSATHITYLNSEYDKKVLEKWKRVYMPADAGVWKNLSAYEYIASHLGYRFMIESLELTPDAHDPSVLHFQMVVCNSGFAPLYRRLTLCLNLLTDDGEMHSFPIDADARHWYPAQQRQVRADINLSSDFFSKYEGELKCYLSATEEASGLSVAFANTMLLPSDGRGTLIGVLAEA